MIVVLQTLVYFRQSLLNVLEKLLVPYYEKFASSFGRLGNAGDEDEEEHVFAEFDDEKGVVFFPPMYLQRYAAVSDCLMDERWCEQLEKVVDLGHHDMSFIKYLKEVPGIRCIIGVDIESIPLRCSSDLLGCEDYAPKRESPLKVTLFQGNAADPDYRLIGTDAVVAIEMIEHMLPHDLDRMVHTVFGFVKPWVAVFTTPNADFNVLFKSMEKNGLRRCDHFFEWTREQFHDWCSNIVTRYPQYMVTCKGVGPGPPGTLQYGCCSQLALFVNRDYQKQYELSPDSLALVASAPSANMMRDIVAGWESPTIDDNTVAGCSSGLNCSTYQVKKFSPTAQKLMAKYKLDSLMHTKEVVSEIRHLTNLLNFSNDSDIHGRNGKHIWHNFNWGENAPYWNQYYKIAREFSYPFETKSEELRILDLITDEINKLADAMYEDECSKIEIPVQRLMKAVSHITDDVDRIKDLLEWNGYEVVDDMVIHCRLVVGNASVTTDAEEWPENDTDWDTSDAMTFSEASTIVPDCNGRALRHALDAKVRKLRAMVSADEDITTELDKVVCRLMKLALRSSKSRTCAPPPKWMQYKLLDLLTLTEKTIAKRKQRCIDGMPLKAIGYGQWECTENASLSIFKNETTATEILNKYKNIMSFSDIDISSAQFLNNKTANNKKVIINDEIKLERTQAWVEKKNQVCLVESPFQNGSIDSSRMKQRLFKSEIRRCSNKRKQFVDMKFSESNLRKVLPIRSSSSSVIRRRYKRYLELHERQRYNFKSQKRIKDHQILQPTASKPIPGSIIDFCHPELRNQNIVYSYQNTVCNDVKIDKTYTDTATTEESLLLDIVMDDTEETIEKKHRIKATDADEDSECSEQEAILNSVIIAAKHDRLDNGQAGADNYESQTIFIYDINEPSTSKGIRHVNMECGTDPISPTHAMPSPASSLTKMPEVFLTGIKIEDSKTNFMRLDGDKSPPKLRMKAKSPSIFSKGIRIGDSTTDISMKNASSNFGTFVSDEDLHGLSHDNAKAIKIEDSLTYAKKKRSLDFGGLKNDEKCLQTESWKIQDVSDIQETKTGEKDFGACTDDSRARINDFNQLRNEIFKKNISIPNMLKVFSEVRDDLPSVIKTYEDNFDFGTSIDDDYINNFNTEGTITATSKKYCTFSTSTDDLKRNLQSTHGLIQFVGVKNKDTNVQTEVDCGAEIVAESLSGTSTKQMQQVASGIKIEDSCSKLNIRLVNCPTEHFNYMVRGEGNLSPAPKMKLSRGGVHVHSYTEKQACEDVMYQGEWQRHRPKANARRTADKKVNVSVFRKKTTSKEKIQNKNLENTNRNEADFIPKKRKICSEERVPSKKVEKKLDNKTDQKKPIQVRRPKFGKLKEDNLAKTKNKLNERKIFLRSNRSVVKVASKIAVSSISSKTKNTLVKRVSAMVPSIVNKDDDKRAKRLKNYVPRYLLRRKIRETERLNLNDTIKINKSQGNIVLGAIQKQLTEFNPELVNTVSYIVFRNEVESLNNTSTKNEEIDSAKEIISKNKENNSISKRNSSPGSSTCSTSDSIATVKAVSTRSKVSTKKHSTPSSKSAINSEYDSNTPVKNKKSVKASSKDHNNLGNKENIPESSDFNKCSLRNIKSAFMGRNKNVFMAKLETDSTTKSKDQCIKSRIRVSVIENKNSKQKCDSPTIKKSTLHLENAENKTQELISDVSAFSHIKNVLEQSFELGFIPPQEYSEDNNVEREISNNTIKTEWFSSAHNSLGSTENTIQAVMRRIVQDRLELAFRSSAFKDYSNDENQGSFWENCRLNVESALSPISYKIDLQENFNSTLFNQLENALNRSFDLETVVDSISIESFAPSLTDNTDALSFKSTSEYFLGDDKVIDNNDSYSLNQSFRAESSNIVEERAKNVYDNVNFVVDKVDLVVSQVNAVVKKVDSVAGKGPAVDQYESNESKSGHNANSLTVVASKERQERPVASNEKSVRDKYERKETLITEFPDGCLAIQDFSGFSMNTDIVTSDQPDYVNLIDSETGSLAFAIARQGTSEEVFVSGTSSESFQSCLLDEDAVVPHWLFNSIHQQQSLNIPAQEEDGELILPMVVPLPMSEPINDINGNAAEPGVGVEAGAGDGRGIHSDTSDDSSGRGTSMSSSETSSGAQSEAILIDPSAFTAQFEWLRESVASSTAVTTLVVPGSSGSLSPLRTEESLVEIGPTSTAQNDATPSRRDGRRYHTSDVDADVSSIDTDLPDSSDN